jgi:hypothetical protein
MDIVALDTPEGWIVGWEIQFGHREGQFVLDDDGSVHYRHPYDDRNWPAGTLDQFRDAAGAWGDYNASVICQAEAVQQAAVERLHARLREIGVLGEAGFWSTLAEQAVQGLL